MTSSSRSRTFARRLRGHCSFNIVVTVLDSRMLDDVIAASSPPPVCFRFNELCGLLTRTSVASQSQTSFRIYSVFQFSSVTEFVSRSLKIKIMTTALRRSSYLTIFRAYNIGLRTNAHRPAHLWRLPATLKYVLNFVCSIFDILEVSNLLLYFS